MVVVICSAGIWASYGRMAQNEKVESSGWGDAILERCTRLLSLECFYSPELYSMAAQVEIEDVCRKRED